MYDDRYFFIGNDIVDLSLEETQGKHTDRRFLQRILNSDELRSLELAPNPKTFLWSLWAAKEATYKVGKKNDPRLIFSPRKFVVDCPPLLNRTNSKIIQSYVDCDTFGVNIQLEYSQDWIHCVAWHAKSKINEKQFQTSVRTIDYEESGCCRPFTSKEMESIHSEESKKVRSLAKEILIKSGFKNVEIIRKSLGDRFGPPLVLSSGELIPLCDLSLSHHGRFCAVVITLVNHMVL